MRRDPRLQGLSSDHHHALVLARRIGRAASEGTADEALAESVWRTYQDELRPHFETEETFLLPALLEAGAENIVARTESEHRAMLGLLERARSGDLDALGEFGTMLTTHVRFEERELFPLCEEKLSGAVLDVLGEHWRAPRERDPG